MNIYFLISFLAYVGILFAIGVVAYITNKRAMALESENAGEFMVGGRSLNFWVTALSAHASDMSSWLFMAFPAMVYASGLFYGWVAIALVIFMFINWHFIAPKIRRETAHYRTQTLSTYFARRYNDHSGTIRLMTALMSLIFFTIYISALLVGIGTLFESVFDLNYSLGVVIGSIIIGAYPYIGGFIGVAWTESFQAIFLVVMIWLVPVVALMKIDGLSAIIVAAQAKGASLSLMPDFSFKTILDATLLVLGWGLGYFGMPHIHAKFMGIKNVEEMHKSKYVGTIWQIIACTGAVAVGLVGMAFFPSGLPNKELIFVEMVKELFHPIIGGFVLCGILAATISAVNSMILVIATVVTEDFYQQMIHQKAKQQELLYVFRLTIIIATLVAAIIAFARISTIYNLVWYAWIGLGCSFGPLMIVSLYSKSVNKWGAMAGIATGGIVSGLWQPLLNPLITTYEIPGMVPSFFASLLAIYLVSAITRK